MTEDRTSTTAEAERGRRELARAVRRLERVLAKNAAAGCSLCVAIGDRTLTIDTELAALARGAATDDPALSGLALRVQGWQVKTLGDLDRLSAVLHW